MKRCDATSMRCDATSLWMKRCDARSMWMKRCDATSMWSHVKPCEAMWSDVKRCEAVLRPSGAVHSIDWWTAMRWRPHSSRSEVEGCGATELSQRFLCRSAVVMLSHSGFWKASRCEKTLFEKIEVVALSLFWHAPHHSTPLLGGRRWCIVYLPNQPPQGIPTRSSSLCSDYFGFTIFHKSIHGAFGIWFSPDPAYPREITKMKRKCSNFWEVKKENKKIEKFWTPESSEKF